MEDEVSTFGLQDEAVSAPDELSLDEPNDPFSTPYAESPAAPEPAPTGFSAGFSWSEPAVEEEAPAASQPWELPAVETAPPPSLSWEEPAAATPEPWSPAPEPEPEPWSPPPAAPVFAAPVVAATVTELSAAEVTPSPVPAPAATNGGGRLNDEEVDRIARRVVELLGDRTVRDIAWEVIPDLAEVIIRDRLRELESQVDLQ
jgi:hypothetical protein